MRSYFPEMWLKHKSIYSRCYWWNFIFLSSDMDSPICMKISPSATLNNPILWGHISWNVAETQIYSQQMPLMNFQISDFKLRLFSGLWSEWYIDHPDCGSHIFLKCGCRQNAILAGVMDWIFNFHGQIRNLLEIPVRMVYNTSWLGKIYIISKNMSLVHPKWPPDTTK